MPNASTRLANQFLFYSAVKVNPETSTVLTSISFPIHECRIGWLLAEQRDVECSYASLSVIRPSFLSLVQPCIIINCGLKRRIICIKRTCSVSYLQAGWDIYREDGRTFQRRIEKSQYIWMNNHELCHILVSLLS